MMNLKRTDRRGLRVRYLSTSGSIRGEIARPRLIQHMTDRDRFRSFVVVKQGSTLLEHRAKFFPNLELGMTINKDVSGDEAYSCSLIISGATTRERLAEFLHLPLRWDREFFFFSSPHPGPGSRYTDESYPRQNRAVTSAPFNK